MTLKETGLSVEQVMSVRDRPLEEAYEIHDVAESMLVTMFNAQGYHCEQHGDDARHADEVFYGDGPDQAIYPGNACVESFSQKNSPCRPPSRSEGVTVPAEDPLCYVEVKAKTDPEWFGRCNLRHFREYVQFARDTNVPVFIWFAYIGEDSEQLHRDAFTEVRDTDQISEDSVDVSDTEVVFDIEDMHQANEELHYIEGSDIVEIHRNDLIVDFIPSVHGNSVVELNDKEFRNLSHVLSRIQS